MSELNLNRRFSARSVTEELKVPLFPAQCKNLQFRAVPQRVNKQKQENAMLIDSGRDAARAEDAQETPTQSHISPIILVYEGKSYREWS